MFTNHTISQLLILILIAVSSIRFLFLSRVKEDTLAVLPVIGLIVAVLNLIAYGRSYLEWTIFILTFFAFTVNFRAFYRVVTRVVIDHYGIGFILFSAICFVVSILVGIQLVRHAAIKPSTSKYEVKVEKFTYKGDFSTGFTQADFPMGKKSLVIHRINSSKLPLNKTSGKTKVVLFVPPMTADYEIYEAFLFKLARDGYVVYCGEFYPKDLNLTGTYKDRTNTRKNYFCWLKLENPEEYRRIAEEKKHYFIEEYKYLYEMSGAASLYEPEFFAVYDDDCDITTELTFDGRISKVFKLSDVAAYKSPGYGPVENTSFYVASKLGLKKDYGFYISNHLAQKFEEFCR